MLTAQVIACVETISEHSATAITGIGQHYTEADTLGSQSVEFAERDLSFALRHAAGRVRPPSHTTSGQ